MSEILRSSEPASRSRVLAVGISLVALTLLAYGRVAQNDFTTFDDHDYLTKNPHVQGGLSREGFVWAFSTMRTGNWHPLTWLSHMLDCQLFGLDATGHHLTSLAVHVATTLLLLHLFLRTTGALGASAFVAAVFALHPLHVESVAWASERKDVLCAFFWMLSLVAYVRWIERPGPLRYALVLGGQVLGLLAKPMMVTFPFTLLLLDLWPLRRFELSRAGRATALRIVREKWPHFILSFAASAVTYVVQRAGGSMEVGGATPFLVRLENSLVSYVAYLGKAVWPARLQAYYPHPFAAYPLGEVAAAALLLAVLTAVAVIVARSRPWLAFGWLWYLGTLVPAIGLVQVGGQSMADRYTYVPLVGISVAVAWSCRDLALRFPRARVAIAALFLLAAGAWTALTWRQVGFWKDDLSLYAIAKVKLEDKYEVHGRLGNSLLKQGRPWEAIEELRRAVALKPDFAEGHNDLAMALEDVGRKIDAVEEYRAALRHRPDLAEAHNNLAGLLAEAGQLDEAIGHYERALESRPEIASIHFDLAVILLARKRTDEAVAHLRRTLELEPGHAGARRALQDAGR